MLPFVNEQSPPFYYNIIIYRYKYQMQLGYPTTHDRPPNSSTTTLLLATATHHHNMYNHLLI